MTEKPKNVSQNMEEKGEKNFLVKNKIIGKKITNQSDPCTWQEEKQSNGT